MKHPGILRPATIVAWAACCIAAAGAAEMGPAEPPALKANEPSITLPGEGTRITMQAVDAGLVNLVRMLADEAGINVIIDPDVSGRVTASFKNITLEQALTMILEANGYAIQQRGNVARVLKAELTSKQINLVAAPIEIVQEEIKQFLSPEGKVIAHPQTASIVVIDRPEVIANIENFISIVDLRERQVSIKARLVEVSLDKHDQLGFEWNWLDTSMTSIHGIRGTVTQDLLPTLASGQGSLRVALSNDHFSSIFQAIQTSQYLELLSAPTITTVNDQEAKVEITEDIPYIESTSSIDTGAGGSTTSTESVEFITVGVTLTVRPQIGDDNHIRMKITPEVSEAPTRYEGIPVVKRRKAETTLIVKDGQTIVLGGLIRENVSDTEHRVPILSSIPLIGNLFKSKDKQIVKVELLIFITPHILDPTLAALDAEEGEQRINEKKEAFK